MNLLLLNSSLKNIKKFVIQSYLKYKDCKLLKNVQLLKFNVELVNKKHVKKNDNLLTRSMFAE